MVRKAESYYQSICLSIHQLDQNIFVFAMHGLLQHVVVVVKNGFKFWFHYDFIAIFKIGSFVFLRGFYLEIAQSSNAYPAGSYIIDLSDNGHIFSNKSLFSLLTVGCHNVYV